MTLKYDEFFVTPSGSVEIRRFLPGKKGKFKQEKIGRNGQLLPGVFEQLEDQDGWSLNLWNEVTMLLESFPYPAHAYVFGIAPDREVPEVTIEFQLSAVLDPSAIKCWKRSGKRWGWEIPRDAHAASSCVQGAFEGKGIKVGGGYQVTYYPIPMTVTSVHDAREKLATSAEVFEETGAGPFLLEPKPWND